MKKISLHNKNQKPQAHDRFGTGRVETQVSLSLAEHYPGTSAKLYIIFSYIFACLLEEEGVK